MKEIIIALACLLYSGGAFSQVFDPSDTLPIPNGVKYGSGYVTHDNYRGVHDRDTSYIDTIPVMILYCDTVFIPDTEYHQFEAIHYSSRDGNLSESIGKSVNHWPGVYWMKGYQTIHRRQSWDEYFGPTVTYLDADKHPLNKSVVVWMAQEIRRAAL